MKRDYEHSLRVSDYCDCLCAYMCARRPFEQWALYLKARDWTCKSSGICASALVCMSVHARACLVLCKSDVLPSSLEAICPVPHPSSFGLDVVPWLSAHDFNKRLHRSCGKPSPLLRFRSLFFRCSLLRNALFSPRVRHRRCDQDAFFMSSSEEQHGSGIF